MSAAAPRILAPREPLADGPTALRTWRHDDILGLAELCRDPLIARWTSLPLDYSTEDATGYVSSREASRRSGESADFAIIATDGGTLLGSISLMRFHWPARRGEVGYWLGAAARGRGHATRAVGLISRWGFRELGLERIELIAAAGNSASQAVAARAGFLREARLRAFSSGPEGREDMVCFARLAGDPAP